MAGISLGTLSVYLKADVKSFEKNLTLAKVALDNLAGTMKTTTKPMVDLGKTIQKTSAKARVGFDNSFSGMIKSMLNFRAFIGKIVHYLTFSIGVQMVMGVRRGIESLIEIFEKFEKSITDAVAISGYVGGAFDDIRERVSDLARTLSKDTVFSAVEVSNAFYDMASAGIDISNVTYKELLPILEYATATQSDLKEATSSVLVTMKAFRLELEDTEMIVDTFTSAITSSFLTMEKMSEAMKYVAPLAGTLGVELQETVAAISALTDVGMEGSQAGQRLNMVFTKLLKPTDKARTMLESIGLTMEDLDPNVYSLVEILYKLRGAGFGAAEATDMFRARTAGAAVVLVDNVDKIARMASAYRQAEGATHAIAEVQQNTLWASIKMMNDALVESATIIGKELSPSLNSLASFVRDTVAPALVGFFGTLKKYWGLIKGLVTLFIVYKVTLFAVAKAQAAWLAIQKLSILFQGRAIASQLTMNAVSTVDISLKAGQAIAAQALATKLNILAASQQMVNTSMLASPVGWFALAIGGIAAAYVLFNKEASVASSTIAATKEEIGLQMDILTEADLILNKYGNDWNELLRSMITDMRRVDVDTIMEQMAEASGESLEKIQNEINELRLEEGLVRIPDWLIDVAKSTLAYTKAHYSHIDVLELLSDEYAGYMYSVDNATISITKAKTAEDKLNDALENNSEDLELISNLTEEYIEKRELATKAEQGWFGSIKNLLVGIRSISTITDKWIGKLEDIASAQTNYDNKQADSLRLLEEQDNAVLELSRAIATYGHDSNEAASAQARLNDITKSRVTILNELDEIQSEITTNQTLYDDVIKYMIDGETELTQTEINLLKSADSLINMRQEYINAQLEEMRLDAEQQSLNYTRENHYKIMEEKLRLFLEAQGKVFDIEEKLYKLRVSEDEQLDDLFTKLADQGMITEEMIELYRELMIAQGEVVSLTHEFTQAYSDLTPEQQAIVDAFMNGEASLQDLINAGIENIDIFVQMKAAQDNLAAATEAFGNELGPLIDSMQDLGLITVEVAQAFYDWIDNANEAAQSSFDLLENQSRLSETMGGLIENTIMLAKSMMGYGDNGETLISVYTQLLEKMGIEEDALTMLNSLYGTTASSLSEFSDEQLYVAATLVSTAKSLGLYEQGMNAIDVATALGIDSLTDLNNIATVSMGSISSYAEVTESLTTASNNFKMASDNLASALNTLAIFTAMSSEEMFNLALKTQFANTIINGFNGDVNSLFSFMESKDWDFDINVMTHWDGKDWVAFYNGLTSVKQEAFRDIVNEKYNIDITTDWDGKDLATYLSDNENTIKEMQSFFDTNKPNLTIETTVRRPPVPRWYSTLLSTLESMSTQSDRAKANYNSWKILGERFGWLAEGGLINGPMMAMIGEKGAEAVIPLEGANRKYGEEILGHIIPKYFPDMGMQHGGVTTSSYSTNNYSSSDFNINGPINITTNSPQDFMEQLKYRYRASKRR